MSENEQNNNKDKLFFNEKKKQMAIQWVNERCPDLICECCHQKAWVLSEDMVITMPFRGSNIVIGGPTYPQVMLICKFCGNSKYFNAVIMGIINGESNERSSSK